MSSSQDSNVAVVTGAGSGVGQATALALAQQGWNVALIGRRERALRDTVAELGDPAAASRMHVYPVDIGKSAEVVSVGEWIVERFGRVDALVNAAGTNAPRRGLEVLSLEDYRLIMDTNLDGAFYCVQAFLPTMRRQGWGTIVNVVSDSAKQASAKAGPAYAMSKFGMAGLTQAINAEERGRGIRACSIFPGDIDTPLLDRRPQPPSADAREKMLRSEDVAACVMLVLNLPARAIVEEIVIRPR